MQKIDLTGRVFSCLTVVKEIAPLNGKKRYLCKCVCGNMVEKAAANLSVNKRQSCGCMKSKWQIELKTTHGGRYKRLYATWKGMKARAANTRPDDSSHYPTYLEKNIQVCEEWRNSFEEFEKWAMSSGYEDTLTIDRIDNNGNYEPSNCQWLTIGENSSKDSKGVTNYKIRTLTDEKVHEIRTFLESEIYTQRTIAKMFNVKEYTISRIKLRKGVCYA